MSKIQEKIDQLKKSGFNLGAAIDTTDQPSFGGGQQRRFKNAIIYWHPVMGTEAHEVHGGILNTYLAHGGTDANPKTGNRELGFPLSDETYTQVGRFPVSYFEWGAILWKQGGIVLFGDFYKAWKTTGAETGSLGYPITGVVDAAGGKAVFFEYGCLWQGADSNNKMVTIDFVMPKMGQPAFISTKNPGGRIGDVLVQCEVKAGVSNNLPASFYVNLLKDRCYLAPTGRPAATPVALSFTKQITEEIADKKYLKCLGTVVNSTDFLENTLYDVAFKLPSGKLYSLAPHAIYTKNAWTNFTAMHATDIHASRRLDSFRSKLKKLGHTEGAEAFNNYNDNFRDLIRYANKLHDAGKLDLIIITGDLVDYEFEEGEYTSLEKHSKGGGNFAFLEKLIRGQAPSPDGAPNDELQVPILTTLGNHDYRVYRFMLNFDVSIPVLKDKTVRNYDPMNLTNEEANALQGGFKTISKEAGVDMVRVNGTFEYFFRRFGDGTFSVSLGKHWIIMLDTKFDKDMIDTNSEAFGTGWDTVANRKKNFAAGNPDSLGLTARQIKQLRRGLDSIKGVVFVGLHTPPINPQGNELPHYFRETEHPKQDIDFANYNTDIFGYLLRNDRDTGGLGQPGSTFMYKHKGWYETEGKPYFFKGEDGSDLLDYGSGKDNLKEFLQLCAGVGVARKADLVLCGHCHRRTEFRLDWDAAKKQLLFYFDFYTENPAQYYPSKKVKFDKPVHIKIRNKGETGRHTLTKQSPWGDYQLLEVAPYSSPLNTFADKAEWWKNHRPLILQTGAVGPIEANQRLQTVIGEKRDYPGPSFQGCRIITVENDLISNISYVDLPSIRRKSLGLFICTNGSGNIWTIKQHTNWDKDWDLIVPGNFGSNEFTDLLFYKKSTSQGLFVSTDGRGDIMTIKQHTTNWDWDLIVPGNFGDNGYTDLLFYKKSTGEGLFISTDGNGNISTLKQHANWDWDLIVPGNFGDNGYTDLLFYKKSTGEGLFVSTDGNGNISTLKQHANWDWDLIVPGNFGGNGYTDLLFYKKSTGEGLFVSTDGNGGISTIKQHTNWDKDWDLIIPGNFGGSDFTDLLFHKQTKEKGLFVSTDGSGNISTLKQHANWNWDLIIPGNFGGRWKYTDLLFYKQG